MDLSAIRALDDDTLAALASKGLLRRAQKDLERDAPSLVVDAPDKIELEFSGEGVAVTIPASGPRTATCTCPAEGVCRHILAALLFLRDTTSAEPLAVPTVDLRGEIMAVGEDALVELGGRALYRQAVADLGGEAEGEIEAGERIVVIRLPRLGVEVRWLAGAGLRGTICSCKQAVCRHRIAAILVYQAVQGRPLPLAEVTALQGAVGAPVGRAELLATIAVTIAESVALGFGRLTAAVEGRLRTLAVAAHGLDLPRLEHMLRVLADNVAWHINRDVRADATQLLDTAARAYALASALSAAGVAAPVGLVGEHRAQYHAVGGLELVGVGAQQWQTRSGYAGLTLFFWDVAGRRWASWGDARPAFHASMGFDPMQRYRQGGVWGDMPTPERLASARLRVNNAKRSRDGRLAAAVGSTANVLGPSDPAALDLSGLRFDDWAALARHVAAARTSGLQETSALTRLAVLASAAWDAPVYDEARQALIRTVRDGGGRELPLVLPHRAEWAFAVTSLQNWSPQRWDTWGVLAEIRMVGDWLEAQPIALFNRQDLPAPLGGKVFNLTLDTMGVAERTPPVAPVPEREADDESAEPEADTDGPQVAGSGAIGRLLVSASAELEQLAERGCAGPGNAADRLAQLAERSRQVGLTVVAGHLDKLGAALSTARHSAAPDLKAAARALLRAYYVVRLSAEELAASRIMATSHEL